MEDPPTTPKDQWAAVQQTTQGMTPMVWWHEGEIIPKPKINTWSPRTTRVTWSQLQWPISSIHLPPEKLGPLSRQARSRSGDKKYYDAIMTTGTRSCEGRESLKAVVVFIIAPKVQDGAEYKNGGVWWLIKILLADHITGLIHFKQLCQTHRVKITLPSWRVQSGDVWIHKHSRQVTRQCVCKRNFYLASQTAL